MADKPIAIGGASRPYPGETANGDLWTVQWHGSSCRLAVIDGLGHGPAAATAAQYAVDVLLEHPAFAPAEAITACHRALRGTRGAVLFVVGIDLQARQLTHASVGNVEAHFLQSGKTRHLIGSRGIVGVTLPTVHTFVVSLEPRWVLLLHTDGVNSRFVLENLPELADLAPEALASAVLAGWGRDTDDATAVVARPQGEQ